MTSISLRGLTLLGLAALTAAPVSGQTNAPTTRLVTAVSVNARLGYDIEFDALVAGGSLRVPMLRLPFELQAAYDFSFLDDLTDRQLALDALWRVGAGLAIGGGALFRSSRYPTEQGDELGPRETRTGWGIVVAIGGAPSRESSMITGLELRWMWVDPFRPRTILAQFGIPLLRF